MSKNKKTEDPGHKIISHQMDVRYKKSDPIGFAKHHLELAEQGWYIANVAFKKSGDMITVQYRKES